MLEPHNDPFLSKAGALYAYLSRLGLILGALGDDFLDPPFNRRASAEPACIRRSTGSGSAWSRNRVSVPEATYSNRTWPSSRTRCFGTSAMYRAACSEKPESVVPSALASITPQSFRPTNKPSPRVRKPSGTRALLRPAQRQGSFQPWTE